MDDDVVAQIQQLVSDVAGVTDAPAPDTPLSTLENWDSLVALNVLLALEEHFAIPTEPDDLASLTSVEAIAAVVNQRRG